MDRWPRADCSCRERVMRARRNGSRGFSLIEMMIVVSILLVTASFAILGMGPMVKQSRVDNAYNATLTTIRQAHDQAAAERRVYVVTFDNTVSPNTVTISQNATMVAGGTLVLKTTLPPDVTFHIEPGIPNTPLGTCPTPDGFGSGTKAIDFDQGVGGGGAISIYFYPDGSGHDAALNGAINSGVVYMARPGELYSSRAVTVWGTTGRIRGWRLYSSNSSGVNCWRPQ
jgi:prepilin-type N-terminal cleavage/methylation domain-containing protein